MFAHDTCLPITVDLAIRRPNASVPVVRREWNIALRVVLGNQPVSRTRREREPMLCTLRIATSQALIDSRVFLLYKMAELQVVSQETVSVTHFALMPHLPGETSRS